MTIPLLLALCTLCASAAAQSPTLAGCPVFPADNIWNTPVDRLPVDRNSAAYVATIGADRPVHPDFGSGLFNGGPIGIPFTTVAGSQARVRVTFEYADESDAGPYPVPPNPPIEGGPNSTGDRHILVLDRDNCVLHELFAAYPQSDGSWRAGSGAIFDLRSHALRAAGWTSADAAGLPILPGLVRYDEVAAGEIRHAIRFTAPQTQRRYIWAARHFASNLTGAEFPPMGQRFRLRADYDVANFSAETQVILRALKKYGIILSDNGSSWFLSGAPDERWNNDRLRELRRLRGADFEAVDTSSLMVDTNSGQVRRGFDRVVNAASFTAGGVAPGEIVSIFGTGLGPTVGISAQPDANGHFGPALGDTRVRFDGIVAPVLYARSDQVNAIVPYAVASRAQTTIEVQFRELLSEAVTLAVAGSAPAIFTRDASGRGAVAAFHPDWTPITDTMPAARGGIVVFYATGEGQTEPNGADGLIALAALPQPRLPVSATIGGQAAEVLYAGAAPGFVAGLMQVNIRVPASLTASGALPLVLAIGNAISRGDVTLAVR